MSGNNKNGNGKKVYVRPVDVAEFIYSVLSKKGKLTEDIEEILDTIIIDLKNEKFSELGEKWGIDP